MSRNRTKQIQISNLMESSPHIKSVKRCLTINNLARFIDTFDISKSSYE